MTGFVKGTDKNIPLFEGFHTFAKKFKKLGFPSQRCIQDANTELNRVLVNF